MSISVAHRSLLSSLVMLATAGSFCLAGDDEIRFDRDIKPILSDKCYYCHGPDRTSELSIEAGFRLDDRDEAIEWGAIVPGDADSSSVIERIYSDDPDLMMPQPSSKLSLTKKEKQTLRKWIESGAEYQKHWAFEPLPDSVPIPRSEASKKWAARPLDHFVFDKLMKSNLTPSGEANPMRWLRRVTFDLTGLPPTVEDLQAFQAEVAGSKNLDAIYESTVDRLLASPAYGEHFAIAWLDAARYADSYGYQSDRLNTQWPYRDWVVKMLNQNLPYDDFIVWQLAGDMLPGPDGTGPTKDQRLATSFNRLHRLNNEGGAVHEEWRIENVADRVHTYGTAMLGLTLECSRCHDHKYDPISMRDYYSLSAFFNTIDESGVFDRAEKIPCPSMLLPTPKQSKALEAAQAKIQAAEKAYAAALTAAEHRYARWLEKQQSDEQETNELVDADLLVAFSFDAEPSEYGQDRTWRPLVDLVAVDDNPLPWLKESRVAPQVLQAVQQQVSNEAAKKAKKTGKKPSAPEVVAPPAGLPKKRQALKLNGERGYTVKGLESIDRWTPVSVVISLRDVEQKSVQAVITQNTYGTDCGYNGWDLVVEDGYLETRLFRVWPGNAIGVRSLQRIPKDEWVQVTATYDGSSKAQGLKLYLNGEPLEVNVLRDNLKKSVSNPAGHSGGFTIGQRFRGRGFAGGLVDDLRIYARDLTAGEVRRLASGEPLEPSLAYYQSAVDKPTREAWGRLREARRKLVMIEQRIHEIPVMDELDTPRETHLLARGAYDAATSDETRVDRATFTDIGPAFPADAPRDRLGLAQWTIHPNHPLTARVAVNRLWTNFFGLGLVRSPDNFGRQGESPTHPELLDWLARDFIVNGWDVKRLCKEIALSAAYRQESRLTAELVEVDPENRLLARGPAHRLSAEQIRDLALATSGLLNPQRGGPPVSPYQPGRDLWRESNKMSPAYRQSVGKDLHRRSLYSVWKRTAPLPNMLAFDAQTREVCTVQRTRTNTPLQALVLLNDPQFVEAARALAEEAIERETETTDRILHAFRTLTGRDPDELEARLLGELHAREVKHYESDKEAAAALLAVGQGTRSKATDPVAAAAMTMVCRAILNLDATVWKR